MKFSHTLFSTVMCSMIAISSQAFAAGAHTAEYDLVKNVRAIAATASTNDQVQAQYHSALTAYNAASTLDNAQNSRFVQALVDNHVYTETQAQALFADALDSSARISNAGASSNVIASEMSRLASVQLRGGQFSACGFVGGTALVGGLSAVVYAAILQHGTTSCGGVTDGNSTVGGCNTSAPSQSDSNLSRNLYIGGGIGIATGVVLLIAAGSGC